MAVAVTGASGLVGGNLVRALLADDRPVRALVYNDTRAVDGLALAQIRGDVLDRASIDELVRGATVVYHLAAQISVDGDPDGKVAAVNVQGTRNIVDACLQAGVQRLDHFSSVHALEDTGGVIDETAPRAGAGAIAYDKSKAGAEQVVVRAVEQGLDVVTLNPGAIFGPHDYKPSPVGKVLVDLFHRRIPALVDGGFCWVDVRDVVAAAIAAESKGRCGECYIVGGQWRSLHGLAELWADACGVPPPRFVAPRWLAKVGLPFVRGYAKLRRVDPLYTGESIDIIAGHRDIRSDKARRELGFDPRPLPQTMADTFEWFCSQGVLQGRS